MTCQRTRDRWRCQIEPFAIPLFTTRRDMPSKNDMSHCTAYLKKPAYFLPSLLGPVWLDLIRSILPS